MKNEDKKKFNKMNNCYKRFNLSEIEDEDIDIGIFNNLETKVKFKNKKYDEYSSLKQNLSSINLKDYNEEKGNINSKSTIYTSKKIEPFLDFIPELNDKDNIENIILSEDSNKKENEWELSLETKKLLDKIFNQKKDKINNNFKLEEQKVNKDNKNINKIKNESNNINNNINNLEYNLLKPFDKKKVQKPIISDKTKEILNKLKYERKNKLLDNNKNSIKNIDTSLSSMSYKYEELVKNPRELILPKRYKLILDSFISLDQFISLNKLKTSKVLNSFDNLRKDIENITHHSFTIKIFQQILYIVPHFYILKYTEKNESSVFNINEALNKNYDLIIEIPKNFREINKKKFPKNFNFLTLNFYDNDDEKQFSPLDRPLDIKESKERINIFKNLLIEIVNKFHIEFLKREKIEIRFEPLIEKTWHHKFDPDIQCKEIPLFEIPLPKQKISVFENIIKKNDIKNQIFEDAYNLTYFQNKGNLTINKDNHYNQDNQEYKNKYVSQKFIDDIKQKQEINQVINEIENCNIYQNTKEDICKFYQEVLIQIKTILLVNEKTLRFSDFADALLNSNSLIKETIIHKEKMGEIIIELSKIFGELFTIKYNSIIGKVVVPVNKYYKIPNKKEIENLIY